MADSEAALRYLQEGVRLFNAGDYFMAHETLEEHWIEAAESQRDFFQGLIHLAVGFLHLGKGNSKGALAQFRKASNRLKNYPDEFLGIDVALIRDLLAKAPNAINNGEVLKPPRL